MTSRSPLLWLFVACMSLVLASPHSDAEQTFFKPGDVIALVGGEDMVAAAEYGYLEALVTRALPDYKLKFRSLAWEGDTVFEQRRDLNYPTLDQQLDKIGATVVIAQFGQMESFAGKEKVPEFITAYGQLLDRLEGAGKRRIVLLSPTHFDASVPLERWTKGFATDLPRPEARNENVRIYINKVAELASRRGIRHINGMKPVIENGDPVPKTRDGVHASWVRLLQFAQTAAFYLISDLPHEKLLLAADWDRLQGELDSEPLERLRRLITAKNRHWFHYYRPQNWAFLAGDRTNQPSSRDHLDPSKRWFPEELEKFIPLIEQKETEIHQLATSLAKP